MTRQAYVLENNNLVVYWSPKAACTTVVNQIFYEVLGLNDRDINGSKSDARGYLGQNYQKNALQSMNYCKNKGFTSIGLIREPYDRLISAYINKFVNYHGNDIDEECKLEPFALNFYRNVLLKEGIVERDSGGYKGVSFKQFVNGVCHVIDSNVQGEPSLDHHWNTQIPFLYREHDFKYDYLFELSDTDAFFEKLGELTGTKLNNKKLNVSSYSEVSVNEDFTDLSSLDLQDESGLSKENLSNSTLREKVLKSFAIDYLYLRSYGYDY
ncbi:sulfotransferase family 2 domain-containing protein [Psychrobacter sp. Marseille-P5312]|uniref:sulfotransferase family 2 domain-containing protein n=1 Tax=Psychrobacter sp. Marseille-P5312 TaxID=2086574 RepID=UPI000CF6CD4F|nr:sulfotransferase family 2 domain-containing protein [Psychrobacter sp. Marseille-P5312]